VKHRTSGKPLQQFVTVRRLENIIYRVRGLANSKALRQSEKVEIVIT
jgi:hypothetical protein